MLGKIIRCTRTDLASAKLWRLISHAVDKLLSIHNLNIQALLEKFTMSLIHELDSQCHAATAGGMQAADEEKEEIRWENRLKWISNYLQACISTSSAIPQEMLKACLSIIRHYPELEARAKTVYSVCPAIQAMLLGASTVSSSSSSIAGEIWELVLDIAGGPKHAIDDQVSTPSTKKKTDLFGAHFTTLYILAMPISSVAQCHGNPMPSLPRSQSSISYWQSTRTLGSDQTR